MDKQEIVRDLKRFFADEMLDGDDSDLAAETSLIDYGLLNSLTVSRLAVHCETRYGVEFEPEDLTPRKLKTLTLIAELILARRGSG